MQRSHFSGIDAVAGGGDDAFNLFLNPTPTPTPAGAGQVGFFDVGDNTVVVASNGPDQARLVIQDTDAVDVFDSFIA